MKNSFKADQALESTYRSWIEQNLQRLASVYKDRFGLPKDGRSVYTQKEFHDFCMAEALTALRAVLPDFFRAILVDHLINTHYNLNRIKVDLDDCGLSAFKKNESK